MNITDTLHLLEQEIATAEEQIKTGTKRKDAAWGKVLALFDEIVGTEKPYTYISPNGMILERGYRRDTKVDQETAKSLLQAKGLWEQATVLIRQLSPDLLQNLLETGLLTADELKEFISDSDTLVRYHKKSSQKTTDTSA